MGFPGPSSYTGVTATSYSVCERRLVRTRVVMSPLTSTCQTPTSVLPLTHVKGIEITDAFDRPTRLGSIRYTRTVGATEWKQGVFLTRTYSLFFFKYTIKLTTATHVFSIKLHYTVFVLNHCWWTHWLHTRLLLGAYLALKRRVFLTYGRWCKQILGHLYFGCTPGKNHKSFCKLTTNHPRHTQTL